MKPTGYTYLSEDEKLNIRLLRTQRFTLNQIVVMTGRSRSTIKRLTKFDI